MTDKRIIYSTFDGGVAVVIPTGELPIEQVLAKDVPTGATGQIVEADVIPSDRSFRGAWTQSDGAIGHDMAKAREIHRGRIRAARDPLLAALDIAVQRELEKPNPSTAQIVAKKQALRDAPAAPAIDAATTIDELKAAWDATLLGPSPY